MNNNIELLTSSWKNLAASERREIRFFYAIEADAKFADMEVDDDSPEVIEGFLQKVAEQNGHIHLWDLMHQRDKTEISYISVNPFRAELKENPIPEGRRLNAMVQMRMGARWEDPNGTWLLLMGYGADDKIYPAGPLPPYGAYISEFYKPYDSCTGMAEEVLQRMEILCWNVTESYNAQAQTREIVIVKDGQEVRVNQDTTDKTKPRFWARCTAFVNMCELLSPSVEN